MGDASNQYIGLIPERQFGAARRKSELRTGSSGLNYGSKNGLRWAAANTPANVDSTGLGASRHFGEVLIIASNGWIASLRICRSPRGRISVLANQAVELTEPQSAIIREALAMPASE
jgi:hypothetical protein